LLETKIMCIFAYEIQTQGLDITKNKIMKTIHELQAEVEKIGEKSKATSAEIDLEASYAGIKTFDADLVMSDLNRLATFHENQSVREKGYSKENLNNSAQSWAESADGHYQAAKMVRETMSYIVRTQKQRNSRRWSKMRNYGI